MSCYLWHTKGSALFESNKSIKKRKKLSKKIYGDKSAAAHTERQLMSEYSNPNCISLDLATKQQ